MSYLISAPLKRIAPEVRETVDPTTLGDDEVFHYSIPALDEHGDGAFELPQDIGSNKLRLRGGEVLISKLNPRISRVLIASSHAVPTLASTEFIALMPGSDIDPRFLCYWLQADTTRQFLDAATLSVTRSQQRVRPGVLTGARVEMPNPPTQRSIADYLDRETARIDALIEAKRRVVGLLVKRMRLAAYEQTSGNGDRIPLRRLLRDIKTGSTPPTAELDRLLRDGSLGWYSPADLGEWLGLSVPERTLRSEAVTEGWVPQFPAGSTLLVGIGATAGKIAYLDHVASGNQQLTCLVAGSGIHPRFLAWQLFGRQDELRSTAPFTTLPILNNEFVRSLIVVVPPRSTQSEIAGRLDREAETSSALTELTEHQINLLHERRQSLITAAVTGQLEIPETA